MLLCAYFVIIILLAMESDHPRLSRAVEDSETSSTVDNGFVFQYLCSYVHVFVMIQRFVVRFEVILPTKYYGKWVRDLRPYVCKLIFC